MKFQVKHTRWNHPSCRDIISQALFSPKAVGRRFVASFGPPFTIQMVAFGHTMVHFVTCVFRYRYLTIMLQSKLCLEDRWSSQRSKYTSKRAHKIYINILAGLYDGEKVTHFKVFFEDMRQKWWVHVMWVKIHHFLPIFLSSIWGLTSGPRIYGELQWTSVRFSEVQWSSVKFHSVDRSIKKYKKNTKKYPIIWGFQIWLNHVTSYISLWVKYKKLEKYNTFSRFWLKMFITKWENILLM